MNHQELNNLLAKMTETGLNEAEKAQLADIIKTDSEARREYLEYCQIHAMLSENFGSLTHLQQDKAKPAKPKRLISLLLTLAAAIAFSFIVIYLSDNQGAAEAAPWRGERIALIEKSVSGEFQYGNNGQALKQGDYLHQGKYVLIDGIIELQYDNKAKVIIEGPAEFQLKTAKLIYLAKGKLSANIPPEAKGFSVDLKNNKVVDLGTQFSVIVNDNESEVHVFEGKVVLNPDSEKELSITENQAFRIQEQSGLISGIDIATEKFVRSLDKPEPTYSELIMSLNPIVYLPMDPEDGHHLINVANPDLKGEVHNPKAMSKTWQQGKVGMALNFKGEEFKGFAKVSNFPNLQGNMVSCSAWVYARSRPIWGSIAKNWAGHRHGQFHFGLYETDGKLEVHINDRKNIEVFAIDPDPFPLKSWQHVAFVANGSELILYRNAKVVGRNKYNIINPDNGLKTLAIGTKLDNQGQLSKVYMGYWDGKIDELAVFHHALSHEEILMLYNGGKK